MRKALTAFIAASAVAFTVVCLPLATPTSATTCDDVQFIFARGSGQKLNDKDYSNFRSEISRELKSKNSSLKISFYELGSSAHGGSQYPAVALNLFNIISAKVSAGNAGSYGTSVKQGVTELKAYISEVTSICKNTKFVISGYSQGAQVVTRSIPNLDSKKIIYAATFGDPKLYLPEGKGIIPDACLGKNLSSYREYAPNCYTFAGSLDAQKPYQPKNWGGKIGLWCKDKDLVCGAGVKLSGDSSGNPFEQLLNNALASHQSYDSDGIFTLAAKTIVKKLQTSFPDKLSATNSSIENRDTVILIDHTGSMRSHIEQYKKEALRLARSTLAGGGRVALYTYGDLLEEVPKRLVDFGGNLDDFTSALNSITVSGGDDDPESLLSALLTVMNTQSWRAGATKSIIALTDASYHNPDRDGTTLVQVAKRSLEIDPVNTYIVSTTSSLTDSYTALTRATGGQYFSTFDSISTDYLLSRPNINFSLDEYFGAPGQSFTFSVSTDDDITSFDWDLDFDGIFETTTTVPSVSKIYNTNTSGYIQVRANTGSHSSSTASTKVTVSDNQIQSPSISNLVVDFDPSNSSATISFDFSDSAIATLIAIDDANLGFATEDYFLITDLNAPVTLTLKPISRSGFFGEEQAIEISPLGIGSVSHTNSTSASTIGSTSDNTSEIIIPLAPNSGKQ